MTAPKLAFETPFGRFYRHPVTSEQVPSVTNVIGQIAKPKLVGWAARMAAEYAVKNWDELDTLLPVERVQRIKGAHERYTEDKGNTGDIVHSLVECWATGLPFPADQVGPFANNFIGFIFGKRPEFIENEVTLWNREYGYAGTADFIARIDGQVLLCDLKTGKSLHEEVGLQLSALLHADFILREDGTEDAMPVIDGIAALHVRPRSWKFVPVSHPAHCFEAFLAAKEILEWQQHIAPRVLEAQ